MTNQPTPLQYLRGAVASLEDALVGVQRATELLTHSRQARPAEPLRRGEGRNFLRTEFSARPSRCAKRRRLETTMIYDMERGVIRMGQDENGQPVGEIIDSELYNLYRSY